MAKPTKWRKAQEPEAPDPIAFAKASTRDVGGRKCLTCRDPVVGPILVKWVVLWKSGESRMSVRQGHRFLREHYGYARTSGSLLNCLASHHGYSPHG